MTYNIRTIIKSIELYWLNNLVTTLILLLVTFINSFAQDKNLSELLPYSFSESKLNLMAFDCELLERDKTKGIVEYKPKPLFVHTSSDFNKWNKSKMLLEAYAFISEQKNNSFLIINIDINSINAKNSYGNLEKNAKLKIYLDNGDYLYLNNLQKEKGKVKRSEDKTSYQCVLPIEKSHKKALQKNKTIMIGIMWEKGYQEYDIQNMDLISNQINCLNQ